MSQFERIKDPADPNRCQATIRSKGQCINKAYTGSRYCLAHGGNVAKKEQEKVSLRNYHLTKFYARAQRMGESTQVKSLRDEVGILRMMLETKLNECQTDYDLMLSSSIISDLIIKIEKVVNSCHKLEGSMGELLDKSAILQFASSVINIIGSEIADEEVISRIANRILQELGDDQGN